MPPRARSLSEADRALWATYARLITPLSGRRSSEAKACRDVPVPILPSAEPSTRTPPVPGARPTRLSSPPLSVGSQPGGLDTATWQRFRAGKLPPARTLDLHGRTVQHAFHALVAFLRNAHADQLRCVEVVTGRGTGLAGGAIRRELPHWLNLPELRPMVLGAAHPHALNPGSVRLLLRRIR
jgi:DNA-nicking Smr family endonuclease